MNNGQQGNSGKGGDSEGTSRPTLGTIPDIIATPPPSRDHLAQLVFPDVSADRRGSEG